MKRIPLLIVCLFALVAEAQPWPVPCAPPPSGLVNWWAFEEESGPSLDRAATRNHGTWSGVLTAEQRPEPFAGKALCFQQKGDSVSIADQDEVDLGAEDFTIAFWVRANSGDVQMIADKRVWQNKKVRGYALFLHKGRPAIQMGNGNGADNYIAPQAIHDGGWHFVVFAVSRTVGGGAIWIDGVVDFTFTPRTGSLDNAAPLVLGHASPGFESGDTRLRGCIDELQVYRFTVLDPAAIAAVQKFYQKHCKADQPKASKFLNAWWRFDEPVGVVARDTVEEDEFNNISRYGATTCPGISGTGLYPPALGSVGSSDIGITFWFGDFSVLFWVRADDPSMNVGRRVLIDKTGVKGKDAWQLFMQDGRLGLELNGVESFPDDLGQPLIADGRWHLVAAEVSPHGPLGGTGAVSVLSETNPKEWEGAFQIFDPEMKFNGIASIRIGGAIQRTPFRGCYDEVQMGRWLYSLDELRAIFKARTHGQEK
jgi:hypothetical protein